MRRPVYGGRALAALLLGAMLGLSAVGAIRASGHTSRTWPLEVRLVPSQASAADWRVLPGVGWVLSGRLEAALHGRCWVDESMLDAVEGVGPVGLARWRPLLVLGVQGR